MAYRPTEWLSASLAQLGLCPGPTTATIDEFAELVPTIAAGMNAKNVAAELDPLVR